MSTIGTYSFLPWLRQGLANQITTPDPNPAVAVRAEVQVQLELRGDKIGGGTQPPEPVSKRVGLFGPGDIQGIEQRAVFRTEPRNWITNFEPNYLPHVEFYDEDFPWRYTPAAADLASGRLRPWIALIVLEEGTEFIEGRDIRDKPLPYVEIANPDDVFPPTEQLWAWAHVHVNRSVAANDGEFRSTDGAAIATRLRAVLNESADLAYSRIVCPRKLDANKAYHAFLMPVFETGRLAGLGLPLTSAPNVTASAWAPYGGKPEPTRFPHYFRWYFRTGATGDFESLVRLLKPKPVDKRVGTRDMDVLDPGFNVRGEDKPELKGVLKLGGALRVPRRNYTETELVDVLKYENWATPYPRPIQQDLARLINLADDYAEAEAADANAAADIKDPEDPTEHDPDPLITLPLYARWHAIQARLLTASDGTPLSPNDNWVHELNLDPRFRVASGFGTRVVQDQQEALMDAAWGQIGRVLEARQRVRFGQFAQEISTIWYDRHLVPLVGASREKGLLMMAPLNKRVLSQGFTVHHHLAESFVQPAMTSPALRRIVRPRGRLAAAMPFTPEIGPGNLLERVNDGVVSASPPKVRPPGIVTVNDIADKVVGDNVPPVIADLLRRFPWLPWLVLAIALVIVILLFLIAAPAVAAAVSVVVAGVAFAIWRLLWRWASQVTATDGIREENRTPQAVDELPRSPDFVLSEPGSNVTPTVGATDSVEAVRFKTGLRDAFTLVDASAQASRVPPKKHLDLTGVATTEVQAINPAITVPRRVLAGISLPERVRVEVGEQFVEPMAYPIFDIPMYEPLKNLSSELFLPNINFIEQNSITIVETNQKFIESYMVGLNHEFSRELLWREYPTDQRGSYFRQFWDARGYFDAEQLPAEQLKEKLRDIPQLHRWPKLSKLGDHDHRELPGENEEELVLVIRGELLKRYPTAVIYAHRACWQRKDDGTPGDQAKHPCQRSGTIDNTKERRLTPLTPQEEAIPPRGKVRTPLYEARVEPDIFFFGFDLTVPEAAGGTGENPQDDPGWFFVIKERPGEPRFGFDIGDPRPPEAPPPPLHIWGDLSWVDVQPGPAGSFVEIDNSTPTRTLVVPTGSESEKLEQHNDDRHITWSKDMNSADLAYVMYQAPVLVAVHASEMLPR